MTGSPFDHLVTMTNALGTFEHADHSEPRPSHGYCTDDMARLLVVVAREPNPSRAVRDLGHTALRFLADAQGVNGRIRNRMSASGRWQDRRGVEDCWGRSIWALGTAARRGADEGTRQRALAYFDHGVQQRSPWPRSMAFAALGASEVLAFDPLHNRARALLLDSAITIGGARSGLGWPWPEPRLSYANAVLPDALLAAGDVLDRPDLVHDGLVLLRWLLDRETVAGHLSPTPVGGAGPDDEAPAFDQQPLEVAAMADACARASDMTGEASWRHGVQLAIAWFAGENDGGEVMWDRETGGGYDGLQAAGVNLNQGTESTIALISTLQHVSRFARSADLAIAAPA